MPDQTLAITLAGLSERLQELHRQTALTPIFNPVFQLSLDISRRLERDEIGIADLSRLIEELEAKSLDARAERLRCLVVPEEAEQRLERQTSADAEFGCAVFLIRPPLIIRIEVAWRGGTPYHADEVRMPALVGALSEALHEWVAPLSLSIAHLERTRR